MSATCPHEAAVLPAAAQDCWTDELRQHVASCDDCAAAASVAEWMTRFAAVPDREHILPSAGVIWLKAKILQNERLAARVSRTATAAQILGHAAIAICWAALLSWKWDAIRAWVGSINPLSISSASAPSGNIIPVLVTMGVLAAVTIALALHTALADE